MATVSSEYDDKKLSESEALDMFNQCKDRVLFCPQWRLHRSKWCIGCGIWASSAGFDDNDPDTFDDVLQALSICHINGTGIKKQCKQLWNVDVSKTKSSMLWKKQLEFILDNITEHPPPLPPILPPSVSPASKPSTQESTVGSPVAIGLPVPSNVASPLADGSFQAAPTFSTPVTAPITTQVIDNPDRDGPNKDSLFAASTPPKSRR